MTFLQETQDYFSLCGEATATKNIFFLLFWPRRRQVLEIFPLLL